MCRVEELVRMRNEIIGRTTNVVEISGKYTEVYEQDKNRGV